MASTVPSPPRRSVGAEGGGGGGDKACQQLSAAEQRRIQQECLCLVRKLQPRIVFYSTSTPTTPKLKTDVAHVRTLLETKGSFGGPVLSYWRDTIEDDFRRRFCLYGTRGTSLRVEFCYDRDLVMGSNGNGRGQWNGPGNGENGVGNNGGNEGNWNQGGPNGNGGGGGGWNGNSNGGGNGGNGWNGNNGGDSWNRGNRGNNWNGNGGNGGNGGWNGNGGNGWNNNGGNQGSSSRDWRRSAECYNCHQYGHISRECKAPRQGNNQGNQGNSYQGNHGNQGGERAPHDGVSTSSSSNEAAVAVGLSKELEEGIRQMCRYTTKQLELEEKKEAEKKAAEEKKKREDEEKAAKEEKSRVELQKKKAKEEKEADREWKLEMLLAKQKESLKEEFERMFEARLRRMVVSERAVKGKAKERLEKRKRQPQQACQVSPQGETPTKVGRGATGTPRAFLGDADKLQEIEDGNELEKTILDMARSA
ncbi:hypothetical protein CBR_g1119 [Chara braunii]|uniref:CCHC-type domain-containing protein n=1 Tax=Chara braunii TaxID=69332 RepID=A0A388KD71_CHABU|nr:hypothetical protein CBR_g1119 [Chara braunii]|eukprot:GBG68000.1 hypothetical protein CBR_g1119 [Chara braunii]